MATRQTSVKIPRNVRVNRAADNLPDLNDYNLKNGTSTEGRGIGTEAYERRRNAARGSALYHINTAPIYNRKPTVKPGGERFKTRFADVADRASTIADGLALINAARKVAAKTGDAELAALVNNPKLNKALDAAIRKLGAGVDSLVREYNATSSDDPEAQPQSFGSGSVNTPTAGNVNAVTGQDSANAYTAWTPEAVAKRAAAQRHVADLGSAIEMDTPQNAMRIRFGLDPVSVDGEALYKMFGHTGPM